MGLTALTRAIAERRTTASEVVEDCLATIEQRDGNLGAFAEVLTDRSKARALDLDNMDMPCGPLHGIPVAIKELVDIAGVPTRFGSTAYADRPASRNAELIDRLERAGAIIIGTTNMVEFALGGWGTNEVRGSPRNPVDMQVHRVAGGSSSGSAVAVAAGLVPAAIGSDTGGSVRIPAALCGLVGAKPSYGTVPVDGVAPLAPSLDTIGTLTRSVEDGRLLLSAMAGTTFHAAERAPSSLVIGFVDQSDLGEIAPSCLDGYRAAQSLIAARGARLIKVRCPRSFADMQERSGRLIAYEAYQSLKPLVEDPTVRLDPFVRARVLAGAGISLREHQERSADTETDRQSVASLFEGMDAILLPTTPLPAVPLAQVDEAAATMSRFTRMANYLGLCAVSLPIRGVPGPFPVGVQLCGPAGADAELLAVAAAVEALCQEAASPAD